MEHQERNYQELGLDSLKRKWLRYLCYLYKIVSTKMPPCLYEILPPLQRSESDPGCFKPFNMSNWTLSKFFLNTFTISEWNKLNPDARNFETYLLIRKNLLTFIKPTENSIYNIYDPLGINFLHRLWLGFSHLCEHKFRHNFVDTVNPLCSFYLEIESTE